MKRACLSVLFSLSVFLLPAQSRAQEATCETTECGSIPAPCSYGGAPPEARRSVVTYHPHDDVGACRPNGTCTDPRANCTAGNRCVVRLRGQIWVPSGPGPFPAVLFSHGSVGCPDSNPHCSHNPMVFYGELEKYFFDQGYVVFAPSRRGYFPSSGLYIDDLIARQMANGECDFLHCSTQDLDQEKFDVNDAFAWLREQPYVKRDADGQAVIGLMGQSLGGIVTLGFNTCTQDVCHIRATVAISPASESWCGDVPLQKQLKNYMDFAGAPVYLLDTLNDVSTAPVITLSHRLGVTDHVYQSGLFAKVVENGHILTCGADAHVCFAMDPDYVARWAPTALAFLQRFGVK